MAAHSRLKTGNHWITVNRTLLVSVPLGVVTATGPVAAPAGTTAVRNVSETTLNEADVPLNDIGRLWSIAK